MYRIKLLKENNILEDNDKDCQDTVFQGQIKLSREKVLSRSERTMRIFQ